MKCPKCGGLKQLTPESKRTEASVWRRRVCKTCHHTWLTEERISPDTKMPTSVWQFTDSVMRHAPKYRPAEEHDAPRFDTSGLESIRW